MVLIASPLSLSIVYPKASSVCHVDLFAVRQLKRGMQNQGSCSSRDCRAAASPNGGISRAGKVAAGGQ